ncbi:uncharacterized protein LOC132837092 [Hemiscyllium ocellatum]|uniref:uncharacterized protein LOC132837092 n=1 Tax=Hemiscyllium ocellatum TaxID=170820 RepID=UPI0029668C8A|nr:uncharacterized protein LOC132837092 [Hemiscyllium ocellatum]XP_060712756.1 uncharacterized protein LOC132837092 [Hemiscyllium ocellatum]XP_060712757.1 uncharacterized protein LOC132837092 [Hemiscyllium ocellatum]XP_060712759.1 uncharacterized protein LOC132837092 [Hemiscyllium ocellatum]XP_060712760.1 uncharacterized protein LOC132837092 [Hemiscyllium ocellatum]XP_060712761.1 uncharacterized protein LOC132837092 [Hemiscyllium ocellatum]
MDYHWRRALPERRRRVVLMISEPRWTGQLLIGLGLCFAVRPSVQVTKDPCGAKVILDADPGIKQTFQFDLCDVIDCGGGAEGAWTGYDVYMCPCSCHPALSDTCAGYPQNLGHVGEGHPCYTWDDVWWGQTHTSTPKRTEYRDFQRKLSLRRGQISAAQRRKNPLLLRTEAGLSNPLYMTGWSSKTCRYWDGQSRHGNPLRTMYWDPERTKVLYLAIGVAVSGKDSVGYIRINLGNTNAARPRAKPDVVQTFETDKLVDPRSRLALATGYTEANAWIDRIIQFSQQAEQENCWVCAKGRPGLIMSRTPFEEGHMDCAVELMSKTNPTVKCRSWEQYFPMAPPTVTPPDFVVLPLLNYTCFTNPRSLARGYRVGSVDVSSCNRSWELTKDGAAKLTVSRADLWWYCGGKTLYNWLPLNWEGSCVLVTLNAPLFLSPRAPGDYTLRKPPRGLDAYVRYRRAVSGPNTWINLATGIVDLKNPHGVWIDAIGQARNIPDEYKLADEIASSFESFPLFAAIFPITTNKNVNRINLIHHNVQRLANLTVDAVDAIHEQLAQTSLMALQNRQALDMLLAEKGGVCAMFGEMCCTSIANSTGPDGKLTRTLRKLRVLAAELKLQSGVSNPVIDWLSKTFGKWGSMLGQLALGLSISVAIFIICGCCCIPCLRTLMTRTIDRALTDKDDHLSSPPSYQAVQQECAGAPCATVSMAGFEMEGDLPPPCYDF